MTPMRLVFLVLAVLAVACASGRVTQGPDIDRGTQAAVRRNEDTFGPQPTSSASTLMEQGGIEQVQNPPTGLAVTLGEGELTRPRERTTPVPVATPTGQPAPAAPDGGVDGGARSR